MSHAKTSSRKTPVHIAILHEDPFLRHHLKTSLTNLLLAYCPGSRLTVSNEVGRIDALLESGTPDAFIYGNAMGHHNGVLFAEEIYTRMRSNPATAALPLVFYTETEDLRLAVRHWRRQGDIRVFHELPHTRGPQDVHTTLRTCWRNTPAPQPVPEPA